MSSLLSLDRMRLLNEVSNPAERETESLLDRGVTCMKLFIIGSIGSI
jgi:hypothetical protein